MDWSIFLDHLIPRLKKTGLKQELAERVIYYNENREASFKQRRQRLAEIESVASRYEAVFTANPANLIQTIREAYESLVKYAESPKVPQTFAELLAALEIFKNHAQEVANSVKLIRDLQKGA